MEQPPPGQIHPASTWLASFDGAPGAVSAWIRLYPELARRAPG
jgi:hypothetical protein